MQSLLSPITPSSFIGWLVCTWYFTDITSFPTTVLWSGYHYYLDFIVEETKAQKKKAICRVFLRRCELRVLTQVKQKANTTMGNNLVSGYRRNIAFWNIFLRYSPASSQCGKNLNKLMNSNAISLNKMRGCSGFTDSILGWAPTLRNLVDCGKTQVWWRKFRISL